MQQQSQKVISQVSNPLNQKSAIKKELENIQQQSLVQKSVDRFNAKAIVGRKPSTSAPCLPTAKSLIPADKPRIEITAVSAPQISAANPGNNLPLNTRKRWFDDIPDEVLRERIISSMTKEQKLRQEVSFELLVTEGYYLRDLSTLLDTYGKPLRTNRKGQRWPELEELFSHIEQLMPVNQVLLDELKKCRRGFVMNAMGEAFLVVADYLKIYTGYCGMQNKTVDYIQRLHKQDSTFKAILKVILIIHVQCLMSN
jgi:hypothetical protein